jgi:hypothetical protein
VLLLEFAGTCAGTVYAQNVINVVDVDVDVDGHSIGSLGESCGGGGAFPLASLVSPTSFAG